MTNKVEIVITASNMAAKAELGATTTATTGLDAAVGRLAERFDRATLAARSAGLAATTAGRSAATAQDNAAAAAKKAADAQAVAAAANDAAADAADRLARGETSAAAAQKASADAAKKQADALAAETRWQQLAADAATKQERATLKAAAAQLAQEKTARDLADGQAKIAAAEEKASAAAATEATALAAAGKAEEDAAEAAEKLARASLAASLAQVAQGQAARTASTDSTSNVASYDGFAKAVGKLSDKLAGAVIAARNQGAAATKAGDAASAAQDKAAAAAARAAVAETAAGAAAEDASVAVDRLAKKEITAAEAADIAATAAKKDAEAQAANALAMKVAADAADKLERATIKAATAQQASGKSDNIARRLAEDAAAEGAPAGDRFIRGFLAKASSLAEGAGPLTAALVGAAAGAAPFAGAALGAGLLAGVGLAGIGAAVAGQINAPIVHTAFTHLAGTAKSELSGVTSSMAKPLADAAGIVENELKLNSGNLSKFIDGLTPSVDKLAEGFANFVGNILTAAPELGQDITPILDALAANLPKLGNTIADFMDDVTTDTTGAAEGLNAIFAVVDGGISIIGNTIGGAELLVHSFFQTIEQGLGIASKIPGWGKIFDDLNKRMHNTLDAGTDGSNGVRKVSAASADAAKQVKALAAATQKLNDNFDSIFGSSLAAASAAITFKDDLAGLSDTVKDNGKSLNTNTSAGRKNAAALLDIASQANTARDAYIKQHSATDGVTTATRTANKIFNANIQALRDQASKLGFSKTGVDNLLKSLGLLPGNKSTNVSVPGATGSASQVRALADALNMLHNKTTFVTTVFQSTGETHVEGWTGGGRERATGGIVGAATGGARSSMTLVGEHGPELLNLPAGSRVSSNPDTERLLGGGGAPAQVELVISAGTSPVEQFLLQLLRKAIRVRGGNVQTVLGQGG